MKLGIVGLPNVGKSTLFNSLTNASIDAANYPFCTIDPNVGIVPVPDKRLDELAKLYSSESVVPSVIEFVDIAGLVKGASKGEGLGNKFLANIREVDAILHVVRCFADDNVIHVDGKIGPLRDIETINLELILSDMEVLDRRYAKSQKTAKSDKLAQAECEIIERIKKDLDNGTCARTIDFSAEEQEIVKSFNLLSHKPVIYVANVSEDEVSDYSANEYVQSVKALADAENSLLTVICAKIESEIAELSPDEKQEFLSELGLSESGLDRIITSSFNLLGLMSYLTAGPKETRAWTIPIGTKAPQAAGKIHTDFERGFIRAEIVGYSDLIRLGSTGACKDAGLLRSEGKEYVIKDGDVVLFRFNV